VFHLNLTSYTTIIIIYYLSLRGPVPFPQCALSLAIGTITRDHRTSKAAFSFVIYTPPVFASCMGLLLLLHVTSISNIVWHSPHLMQDCKPQAPASPMGRIVRSHLPGEVKDKERDISPAPMDTFPDVTRFHILQISYHARHVCLGHGICHSYKLIISPCLIRTPKRLLQTL